MQTIEILKNEHEAVITVLEILEKLSTKIRAGQDIEIQTLEQLLLILKEYVDQCHHGKEEKILFPALEGIGLSRQNGPVGVMFMEHDNGRQYIQGMNNAVTAFKNGDQAAIKSFAANASYYVTLMQEHIYKENNILYPMADMHLPQDIHTTMLENFNQIEAETIGTGNDAKYLRMITEIKASLEK